VKVLVNNIHEIGQWPSVKFILCKKKPKDTKFSFIMNTAKIVGKKLRRRIGTQVTIRGEDKVGFRKARGS